MHTGATEYSRGREDNNTGMLAAAIFVLIIYPFFGMIWYHQYPVISLEVMIVLVTCLATSELLSLALSQIQSPVRNLVLVLLITIAFLVHFNLFFHGFVLVCATSLLLAIVFGKKFPEFVLYGLIGMLCGAWLDNKISPATELTEVEPASTQTMRGPVIHLLMDGFTGPDGLPGTEESGNLRQEVISFFGDYDFELHTRAYSHYSSTLDSMTRAFNFRHDASNLFQRTRIMREPMVVSNNKWFDLLDRSGYQLNVYQTESMDFCGVRLSKKINCNTFSMPNLRTVHADLDPALARVPVLLNTLASQSAILTKVLRQARLLESWGVSVYDERMLQKLAHDVTSQPGSAFFAHVLVPHSPLVFREDCSIDYTGPTWMRWSASTGLVGNNNGSREARYRRIVPQMKCAMRLLNTLFSALKQDGLYDAATILVHGDHGSSAYLYSPSVHNLQHSNQRDFLEVFSTLFAVKWPNGTFRKVEEISSLDSLMAQTAMRLTGNGAEELGNEIAEATEPFVYLSGEEPLRKMYVNIFDKSGGSVRSSDQ